jgi:hypothetical protein
MAPVTQIRLDYPIDPQPRYGYGKPLHRGLSEILARRTAEYERQVRSFLQYAEQLTAIPVDEVKKDPACPHWQNIWFSGIDPLSLYGFLRNRKPRRYLEVGSGHSTRFARRAIRDGKLETRLISIDPAPRAEIDAICDEVIRSPLEHADLAVFSTLEAGDILFVDNSHRVFTNSDVAVTFLDVFPLLRPGVLVGLHDIMLPRDYPPHWSERFYSEQYMLAAWLLADGSKSQTVLPCTYIQEATDFQGILKPIWSRLAGVNPSGSSFWMEFG